MDPVFTFRHLSGPEPASNQLQGGSATGSRGISASDQYGLNPGSGLSGHDTDQRSEFWKTLGSNLCFPGLALAMLYFFWRAFKRARNENIPIDVPQDELFVATNGHGKSTKGRSSSPGGIVTVDILNQWIRENPDNVTQAIRAWMTRGNAHRPHATNP